MVIGCLQPDDFGVTRGRLREEIGVGGDEIGKLHLWLVGVPAGAQHMSFQVNRRGVVRGDRKDVNLVTVLHGETAQFGRDCILIAGFSYLDTQHRALFMCHQTLHFNMPKSRSRQNSACQVKSILEGLFAAHFVKRGAAHHTFYCDYGTKRRHEQGISIFKPLEVATDPVKEQVVGIYLFDQLLSPVVLKPPERTLWCHSPCSEESV